MLLENNPKAEIRDELIWKMVDMIQRHRKELQAKCFFYLGDHPVNTITREMFCDMDEMLGQVDRYRQREEW